MISPLQEEFDYAKFSYYLNSKKDNSKGDIFELLERIIVEDNPINGLNQYLSICQLYFDGLVEKKEGNLNEKLLILNKLFLQGKSTVGSFYRNCEINFNNIRDLINKYGEKIYNYSSLKESKKRNLMGAYLGTRKLGYYLPQYIQEPDIVVSIASGAFESTFLAMDIFDLNNFLVLRYSTLYRSDKNVKLPINYPINLVKEQINGKRVLLIDDILCFGTTLNAVTNYILEYNPSSLDIGIVNGYVKNDNSNFYIKKESDPLFLEKK